MSRIPDSFLQEVAERCPVESVVADYVDLKRTGSNLVGLCPFHREKTPSFTVSPGKQMFYCFGCGAGGGVFQFIMKMENVEFYDAVALLAKRAGLTMPEGEDRDITKRRATLLEMNKAAARFYHATLVSPEGAKGMEYLQKRKLSMSTIRHFGLGYSPEQGYALVNHLTSLGYTKGDLQESGLVSISKKGNMFDRFRGRVMFPIINVRGEVIAFGGRVLDDSLPKYLNSPETLVFNKSRNLFGINFAKKEQNQPYLLAEGYMDVIALHAAGFRTAVASLGTALTPDQARLILRYTKEVVICYDSDQAGVKASNRAIGVLKEAGVSVKVLTIQGGKDPDEFIKTYGSERFARLLKGSDNYIDYRLEKLAEKYDMESIPQKVEFLKEAAKVMCDIESAIERELYVEKLCKTYETSKEAMMEEVQRQQRSRVKRARVDRQRQEMERITPKIITKDKDYNSKAFMAEQNLLGLIYRNNEVYFTIKDQISEHDFLNHLHARMFGYFGERISQGEPLDVTLMQEDFDVDEVSYIASILSKDVEYDDRDRAAQDFIQAILGEKRKMMALNGNDDDMKEMMEWYEQIQKKKK